MKRFLVAALFILTLTAPLDAHPGHVHASSQSPLRSAFGYGFLHPISGIDHLMAMVAIGMLSVRSGGRALWLGPLSFLSGMSAGGILGVAHAGGPVGEMWVALSVVSLGLTLAVGRTTPRMIMLIAFALFGCLHGYAHGVEVPDVTQAISYGCGFLIGSILLNVVGIGFGLAFNHRRKFSWTNPMRISGSAITLAGLLLMMRN